MSEIGSLLFYLISFFMSVILYKLYCKHKYKLFLLLSFSIPMIIGGFRYMVGTDYVTYLEMYKHNLSASLSFNFISKIATHLGGPTALFFIYNFLTLFFIYLGMKNVDEKSRPLVLLCYFFTSYTTSFNIMRQALAISIIFYAYKYIVDRDLKKWLLFILLAFLAHDTSLLCLPFYFIIHMKNNKLRFLILIITLIASFNYVEIVNFISSFSHFSHYSLYANNVEGLANNRMFFLDLLIYLYILLYRKKIISYDKKIDLFIFMFSIGLVLELTGFFNPYVKRIAEYFLISKILILPYVPLVQTNGKKKLIHYLIVSLYCVIVFIIVVYILKQANIIPYRFVGGLL